MGYVPDWSRQDHKKTSAAKPKEGIKSMGSLFHGQPEPKIQKSPKTTLFAADGTEGGVEEALLKQEGLKASEGEKVGFFERLRAGNIDEAGSEAYNRFGAGRAQADRDEVTRLSNRAAASSADTGSSYDESPAETARLSRQASDVTSAPAMTAADFQRTDKDTTPVPMPSPRRAASKPAAKPAVDQAETDRQSKAAQQEIDSGMYRRASDEAKKSETPKKSERGYSILDATPYGLARSVVEGGRAIGSWFNGSRSSETPEQRQARLNAASAPSGYRPGASLMDRGRVSGNYADGGMVKKGKRKC